MGKDMNKKLDKVVLLPCPFCGNEHLILRESGGLYRVSCALTRFFDHGIKERGCALDSPSFGSEELAIKAWNTRAASTPPQSDGLREERYRKKYESTMRWAIVAYDKLKLTNDIATLGGDIATAYCALDSLMHENQNWEKTYED